MLISQETALSVPSSRGLSLNAIDVFANVEGAVAKSYVAQLVMTDALAFVGLDAAGQETGVGRHHRDMVEEYGVDATPRCAVILLRAEDAQVKDTSAADGLGMGCGFTLAITVIAIIREILGNGTVFGLSVFGAGYEPMLLMILAPGGFLVFGGVLAVTNLITARAEAKKKDEKGVIHA